MMTKLFSTTIDMDKKLREDMIGLLNHQLADQFDLYSQIKQAHWNVKGMNFMQLHLLFDQLGEEVLPAIDTIAERVVILGGTALGTARMAAAATRLEEMPVVFVNEKQSIELLVKRFAVLAASTRAGIKTVAEAGDADTADLLTGVSRTLDKSRWFLEAHLQG